MFGFQPTPPLAGGSGAGGCVPVAFESSPAPLEGYVGTPLTYDCNINNTGGAATTWTASYLPGGLSLNASTGIISGTPTTTESGTLTLTASNACSSSSIPVMYTIN